MKVEDVYIDSLGVFLPEWLSAEQAVADGILDPEIPETNGLTGTYDGGDIPAMDMAVSAAREALERSKLDADDIEGVIHSAVNYQGPVGAFPPGYIMRELGIGKVPAQYLRQGCDGMLGSLEVAIGRMTGAAEAEAVLLTSGENFTAPGADRWNDGFGHSYFFSDGGMAVLLSADEGFAQVRSLNSGVLSTLEKWHRGNGPLLERGNPEDTPTMPERAQQFNETEMPLSEALEKLTLFNIDIIHRSLVDADLNASDLAKVVPIHMDGRMLEFGTMMPLGLTMERSSFDFGRSVGHVGGADVFISLEHLVRTGQVGAGDNVLLISQGPGWLCTACVVTILNPPPWAA
ncbi:ketoacyl-ACP synthase III family protein [Streptomyces sp. NPDC020742]|uniref:ketoacyl-ACP synthase III family protein n=1 Tax=unclassified Streptomyces TaxID=2593676 RepID=UPI0033CC20BC